MAAPVSNGNGADTHYPSPTDAGNSINRAGFRITTRKLPILKAAPIERMTAALGIAVPEMIFGDNFVRVEHPATGWAIEFSAFEALDLVDKTGEAMLQVAHSREWQSTRQEKHSTINHIVKPFDWSYTTAYRGSVTAPNPTLAFTPADPASLPHNGIPLALLRRPDPILLFDDLVLYEDEMADNGITMLSVKIRVMPERLLLLARFFMRLDGVMFRLRDTRVYVEFATGEVLREYVVKEEAYEVVAENLRTSRDDALAQMRDPNRLAEVLPIKEQSLERVVVK